MRTKHLQSSRGSIEVIVLVVALTVTLGAASWWVYAQRSSSAGQTQQDVEVMTSVESDAAEVKELEATSDDAIPSDTGVE